jgi:hypothetical protein
MVPTPLAHLAAKPDQDTGVKGEPVDLHAAAMMQEIADFIGVVSAKISWGAVRNVVGIHAARSPAI